MTGGRLALMTKVHHAGVDGVTGANLMSQLCTTEADAPPPEPVDGVGGATGAGDRHQRCTQVRGPPAEAGQRAALHCEHRHRHRAPGRQRPGDGRPVQCTEDRVQHQHHRAAQRRIRPAGPRGHQDGQEPLRRQGQRRGDGAGVRRAAYASCSTAANYRTAPLVAMVPVSVHDRSDRPGRNPGVRGCSPSSKPTSTIRPSG